MPHYEKLLDFIDLRAQASKMSCATHKKKLRSLHLLPTLPALMVLSARLRNIPCTFAPNSSHFLMMKRPLYSRLITSAPTASQAATTSDSASRYTSARYARKCTTLYCMLNHKVQPSLVDLKTLRHIQP